MGGGRRGIESELREWVKVKKSDVEWVEVNGCEGREGTLYKWSERDGK